MLRSCSSASGPGSPCSAASSACCWLDAWLQSVVELVVRLCRQHTQTRGDRAVGGPPCYQQAAGMSRLGQTAMHSPGALHAGSAHTPARQRSTPQRSAVRRTVMPSAMAAALRRNEVCRLSTTALVCSALFSCERATVAIGVRHHSLHHVQEAKAVDLKNNAAASDCTWQQQPQLAPHLLQLFQLCLSPSKLLLQLPAVGLQVRQMRMPPCLSSICVSRNPAHDSFACSRVLLCPQPQANASRSQQTPCFNCTCTSAFFFFSACTWSGGL